MNLLAKLLDETGLMFDTARGIEIVKGKKFRKVSETVTDLQNNNEVHVMLKALLGTISTKIEGFCENSVNNGFLAVEWCIKHNLIQQGITILQETAITWLCDKNNLDWKIAENRELVSQALNITAKNKPSEEWNKLSKDREQDSIKIQEKIKKYAGLTGSFSSLTTLRNDINHGGYLDENGRKALSAEKFKTGLEKNYSQFKDLLNKEGL